MRIVIDLFDQKSVAAAMRQLRQYKKDLTVKETEFIRRVTALGVSVARTEFATAAYDGVKDVQIKHEQHGGRATIIAYGQTVGFIEFGTGVRFREYDSTTSDFTPPPHGSYGEGKGKQPWGWWYKPEDGGKGRHTYGNPPAEAMLAARNAMVEQIVQIAREVFK